MLSGDNGILQKATTAKENTGNAQVREKIRLAYSSALTKDILDQKGEVQKSTFADELKNEFPGKTFDISESADKKEWLITIDDVTENVPIGKDTPKVDILPSGNGTKPYLPSSSFSQLEGTDLITGLVITDEVDEHGNSIGNEYVWIEVPSTYVDESVTSGPKYKEKGITKDNYESKTTEIAEALRAYCEDVIATGTSSGDNKTTTKGYTDEWYAWNATSNSIILHTTTDANEKLLTNGCGVNYKDYYELKDKMLKSIYTNGGFWIGRYEAGTTIARNNGDLSNGVTPLSKIDVYPINWIKCSEAQQIAGSVPNIDTSKYKSSLMFGIQWDLVLKFIKIKESLTDNTLLTSNSTTWGNYYNNTYNITNINAWHSADYGANWTKGAYDKTSNGSILLTTGAHIDFSKQKIYDFAGNVREWTLEQTSFSSYPCALRGGIGGFAGEGPSSFRGSNDPNYSYIDLGFRVALY